MFLQSDKPLTPAGKFLAVGAVIAGLIFGFIMVTAGSGSDDTPDQMMAAMPDGSEEGVASEPLDARGQVARDMVTPDAPGTPVMPSGLAALDPADYSRDLARFIPIEIGMDRFAVIDELRLYYNDGADVASKISSAEQRVNDDVVILFRRSGLPDDSVAAEETFARFSEEKLVDFGSRIQCYRGPRANAWTTELCP